MVDDENLFQITNETDLRLKILEDGLQISNVQTSDKQTYRCYVYNEYGTEYLDILATLVGES